MALVCVQREELRTLLLALDRCLTGTARRTQQRTMTAEDDLFYV